MSTPPHAHTLTRSTSALRALADAVGIVDRYEDQSGEECRETRDETRELLLGAMGFDVSSDEAAARSLEELRAREANRALEPVRVVEASDPAATRLVVRLAEPTAKPVRWTLELREEAGAVYRAEGEAPYGASYELVLELPAVPPLGYHTLRVAVESEGGATAAEQSLIVVPSSCVRVEERLGDAHVAGIIVNLYSVRTARNWGVGDLRDLADLLKWSGEHGFDFVGVNPLHALLNRGGDVSPYSPVSRLFRNPLYLAVEEIPAFAESAAAQALVADAEFQRELEELRAAHWLDYGRVMALKLPVLRVLHRHVRAHVNPVERRAYDEWCAARQPELDDFATFMAIAEAVAMPGGWPAWPPELHHAHGAAVAEFRARHELEVDFHRWLQWEIDRQLATAARTACEARMSLGLYQDLAIGTSPVGSDSWSFADLFVRRVHVGAPPDPYSATGQDWGLPPLDPRKLRENGYRYWIKLLRSAFRHAGALRIDHVMGLFRLFWIPEGHSGTDGAYVRYPAADLLGILALESVRHRALVVGEDLGTVPSEVPPALRKWGILSSKVLYFERENDGRYRPAREYAHDALATANTHDMPTLTAFLEGKDLELREKVGLTKPEDMDAVRAARARDRELLLERLRAEGVLDAADPTPAEFRDAVHAFLRRTPSALVGFSLDDLEGEVEPVNVPGVGPEGYPSWKRRMRGER